MKRPVGAILLAAGASRRMGTSKPLLDWQGKPLVKQLVEVLTAGGAGRTIVVVAPGEAGRAVTNLGLETILNPAPERGMLSSVHVGLIELGEGPFLVCPCDLPKLTAAQVRAVIEAWGGGDAEIVAPARAGKRGHPTLFGKNYWRKALELDPMTFGLNVLLKSYPITEITVDDEGPFRDADTPDEWTRLLAQE